MSIVRYPIASSIMLARAFNFDDDTDDAIFLYSADITGTGLGMKLAKGSMVSYGTTRDCGVQLMDDSDPQAWGASQFVVKDVVVKPCKDLSTRDIQMVERARPGFSAAFEEMRLKLGGDQIITLVRFSLKNTIHFSNRFLPDHIEKLVH